MTGDLPTSKIIDAREHMEENKCLVFLLGVISHKFLFLRWATARGRFGDLPRELQKIIFDMVDDPPIAYTKFSSREAVVLIPGAHVIPPYLRKTQAYCDPRFEDEAYELGMWAAVAALERHNKS
jgi:hypothetical protein